jgi:SAM-dependent methyltransferase
MKLKKNLPPDRSYEQILNHYLVEKSIADRLKSSDREERRRIFNTMYEELFSKVPDHPRLTRRNSSQLTEIANKRKFFVIRRFIEKPYLFAEFAPGDCKFAYEVAKHVNQVFGIDISDQHDPADTVPDNFRLIVYDGYNLDAIESNSVDVMFSYQLIEHFHPEDTALHFELVHRILKPGGKYVFLTPHALSGPYDISEYFCDEPECFHLKEWTYTEIKALLKNLKYTDFQTHWFAKSIDLKLPYSYFALCERTLSVFPKRFIKKVSRGLIPILYAVAIK